MRGRIMESPLKNLLLHACPPSVVSQKNKKKYIATTPEIGKKSIPALAFHVGTVSQNVYKWIKTERITFQKAQRIVEISDGRITIDDLNAYIV